MRARPADTGLDAATRAELYDLLINNPAWPPYSSFDTRTFCAVGFTAEQRSALELDCATPDT